MYVCLLFFFFNDTATTEIYTLSLHDALPISGGVLEVVRDAAEEQRDVVEQLLGGEDAVRVEAHAARDPLQPAPGELVALLPQPHRQRDGEGAVRRDVERIPGARFGHRRRRGWSLNRRRRCEMR